MLRAPVSVLFIHSSDYLVQLVSYDDSINGQAISECNSGGGMWTK